MQDVDNRIAKTVIYMPLFNRKAIALESIANMRQVKGGAHLKIIDDCSTEFDGRDLVALGDSGHVNPQNLGIDANRMNMLVEFFASEFDYGYFTDSDTIHDPEFLSRALFMHGRTNCLCCLYNTASFRHKDGFNIDIGDDIIIRRTIPGVSMFFDKNMAFRLIQHYLDAVRFRPAVVAESRAWDWFLCSIVPQVALSRISYLEHLFTGGLHVQNGRDVAAHPTPYLAAERCRVFTRLGIPLEDGGAS
jgi:glycosyltransferase involved in cell wall biosynthesis